MEDPQADQLIGSGDLARLLRVSISTVKRFDRIGILPPSRRIAGRRVWGSEQLPLIESAIEKRRIGRQQESGKAA